MPDSTISSSSLCSPKPSNRVSTPLSVPNPMGTVLTQELSDWWPVTTPGVYRFYGRFSDLWRLHDALTEVELPLTRRATMDPVVEWVGYPNGINPAPVATADICEHAVVLFALATSRFKYE